MTVTCGYLSIVTIGMESKTTELKALPACQELLERLSVGIQNNRIESYWDGKDFINLRASKESKTTELKGVGLPRGSRPGPQERI